MYIIVEDHGTDDYQENIAITDNEIIAQETILSLAEETIYNSFYEALHGSYSISINIKTIIENYIKCRLNSFGWQFYYEKIPYIH